MRFLYASGRRGRLPRGLGGELLPWGLASGGLPRGLLGTGHGGEERRGAETKVKFSAKMETFGFTWSDEGEIGTERVGCEMGWGKEEEVAEN